MIGAGKVYCIDNACDGLDIAAATNQTDFGLDVTCGTPVRLPNGMLRSCKNTGVTCGDVCVECRDCIYQAIPVDSDFLGTTGKNPAGASECSQFKGSWITTRQLMRMPWIFGVPSTGVAAL